MKPHLIRDMRSLRVNRSPTSSGARCFGRLFVVVMTMFGWFESSGCSSAPPDIPAHSVTQKALIGKTKAELMACATVQPDERTVGDLTILRYYQEASVLEESFPATKSSVARVHHGCWAMVGLKNDRVEGIRYDSVPSSYQGDDHCDEIFVNCLGK